MSENINQIEMIFTGMLILSANMESFMNELKIERRKIQRLLSQIEGRLAESRIQITYL